jgi:hypothetical protein
MRRTEVYAQAHRPSAPGPEWLVEPTGYRDSRGSRPGGRGRPGTTSWVPALSTDGDRIRGPRSTLVMIN